MIVLLPCPFCGADPEIKGRKTVMVTCTKCTATTFQRLEDKASAIADWNLRAGDQASRLTNDIGRGK